MSKMLFTEGRLQAFERMMQQVPQGEKHEEDDKTGRSNAGKLKEQEICNEKDID